MNRTTLIGHIGKDATVTQLKDTFVINFTLAQTEAWLDNNAVKQEKTRWYDCSLFRKKQELSQYLKKGTLVCITGVVDAKTWINKEGGHSEGLALRVDELELLGGKKE